MVVLCKYRVSASIMGHVNVTVYWESFVEQKLHEFQESVSIHECFLALFISARIFIHEIA